MKNCSICGTANEDSASLCAYCGSELPVSAPAEQPAKKKGGFSFGRKKQDAPAAPEGKVCPVCGTMNGGADQYCSACFAELKGNGGDSNSSADAGLGPNICPVCGMENGAGETYCCSCGTQLSAPQTNTGKKKKNNAGMGKIAWIGAGIAAVIALVAGVSLLLGGISNPAAKAMDRVADSMSEQVHLMPNLGSFTDNFVKLNESGEFALILDVEMPENDLNGTVYYDRRDKLMSGSLTLESTAANMVGGVNFSLSNKELMLQKQGSGEVFGCNMNKLANTFVVELINDSQLLAKMGIHMDQNSLNNLFKKMDDPLDLEKNLQEAWKKLSKSLEVDETAEQDGYRVYIVSLEEDSIEEFLASVMGEGQLRKNVSQVLSGLSPNIKLYIDSDGNLAKADMLFSGEKCYLNFTDPANPLSECVITSDSGSIQGVIQANSSGLSAALDCYSGNGGILLYITYQDATGDFRFDVDFGNGDHWQIDGKLSSRNGQAMVELSGYVPQMGDINVRIGLDKLAVEPAELSPNGKYLDLLDMENISRLIDEFSR